MSGTLRLLPGICLALSAGAALAAPDSSGKWYSRTKQDTAAVLSQAFPNSAAWLRQLIGEQVEAGERQAAKASLDRLAAMGFALSPAGQARLGDLIDSALAARFAGNARSVGTVRLEATLPVEYGLVESTVSVRGVTVASGVTAQDLFVSVKSKPWRPLGLTGLGSLTGLVADRKAGLVWVSSGIYEQSPKPENVFSGLVAIDPQRGQIVRRIAIPSGGVPSDITLASDGTLFASDPLSGAIWRADPGASVLTLLVPAGRLRSPQGLALAADGRRLYASDYGYGIAVIDLRTGEIERLPCAVPAMLDGIDGLVISGNRLIGIQNGTRPIRIVSLRLVKGSNAIERVDTLLAAPNVAGEPTSGEIRGGRLYYVANARWDLYGKGGAVTGKEAPGATMLHSLPLSPN